MILITNKDRGVCNGYFMGIIEYYKMWECLEMGIPSAMATLEDDQPSGFKDARLSDKPR